MTNEWQSQQIIQHESWLFFKIDHRSQFDTHWCHYQEQVRIGHPWAQPFQLLKMPQTQMGVKKKPDGLRIRNVNRDVSIKSYVYTKNTEFSETLVRWPLFLPLPILHDFVRFYECKQCWKTDCYQKTLAQMKKGTRRKPPEKNSWNTDCCWVFTMND